jgi:hypothetical protein
MTNHNRNGLSITLTSLSSTLENCLIWHEGGILSWRRSRGYLAAKIEQERQRNGRSFDRSEFDSANEKWFLWEGKMAAYELLLDLYVAVTNNPFPGQKLRLLEVAYTLFPQAEGGFISGERLRGRGYWKAVFLAFDLRSGVSIWFPAKVDEIDVVEVERKLIELAADDNFVPLKVAAEALPWEPRSKTYRAVKVNLESKGWRWGMLKRDGNVNRGIFTPVG